MDPVWTSPRYGHVYLQWPFAHLVNLHGPKMPEEVRRKVVNVDLRSRLVHHIGESSAKYNLVYIRGLQHICFHLLHSERDLDPVIVEVKNCYGRWLVLHPYLCMIVYSSLPKEEVLRRLYSLRLLREKVRALNGG